MQLSKNFSLEELVKSQTAVRCGIDNTPNADQIAAMRLVAQNILQPVRDHFHRAVFVSSGFRCVALCEEIGSKATSQHAQGEAADFEVSGKSNPAVATWIRDNLDFDQLILEFYDPAEGPNSGWVHCSYKAAGNRKSVLTINKHGTTQGLIV